MDTASIFSGILGSVVGTSATIATGWIAQRTLHKRELLSLEIRKRETLYGEFISECSKLIIDSYGHTLEKPETLLPVYALLNRIRLTASDTVLARAEHILVWITEQYFSPNHLPEDVHALVNSPWTDPLKPFGDACREELKSIHSMHGYFVTTHF